MGLFDVFKSKRFTELFEKTLEKEMTNLKNESEIYNKIVNYYLLLLKFLNVKSFSSFHFIDYDDCRRVDVDGYKYDFDSRFRHNDRAATEALCAIDCLMADLEDENLENILKQVEEIINKQNKKMK